MKKYVYCQCNWRWGKTVVINLSDGRGGVEVQYKTGGNTGYINNLYVVPELRGKFVGKDLMWEAETDIVREGRDWANLLVEADKANLIKWYEGQGYRRISFTEKWDAVEEDEGYVRLWKQLKVVPYA